MYLQRFRPSPSMVVALLALSVAIGGTAFAANKIGTNDLKNNAVTSKKIKKKAVNQYKIAPKSVKKGKIAGDAVNKYKIADGAVDGSKVADDSLGDSKTSDYKVLGFLQVNATNGPTDALARAAAPEHSLFTKGPLEVYAKCFRNTVSNTLRGEMFVRTSTDFSIMEGSDDLPGGPLATDYLNTATPEVNRQLDTESVGANDANFFETEGMAAAADGTAIHFLTGIGTKNGAAFNDGPYGPGNACIFQGAAMG